MTTRRFPPPWTVEDGRLGGIGHHAKESNITHKVARNDPNAVSVWALEMPVYTRTDDVAIKSRRRLRSADGLQQCA
jgi:hypothetical protein